MGREHSVWYTMCTSITELLETAIMYVPLSLLGHSTQYIVQYLGSWMFSTVITHQVMDA